MFKKYFLAPHWRRMLINAFIKISGTLFEVVLPTILAHLINQVVPRENRKEIWLWGLFMLFCSFMAWILNVTANRMASKTSALTIREIRQDLFYRSIHLSARQIDQIGVSSLETRLTSDSYVIHRFLSALMRMGLRSTFLFLGGVIFCVSLSWRLSFVLLLLILPLGYTISSILGQSRPMFRELQRKIDDMVQVIRENIRGIRVSKALVKTNYEKERFAKANAIVKNQESKAMRRMASLPPLVNFILFFGLAAVIVYGGYLSNLGLVQVGTVIAFISYFFQITNSLLAMNRMFGIYNRSQASAERIEQLLSLPMDEHQEDDSQKLDLPESNPEVPEIEFRDVSFSYLGKKNNLQGLSFRLMPGESLGIMGATGSGKSTILRLLLRQYEVDSGEILIRGIPLQKLKLEQFRSILGMAFQNDFLFGGSIRDNIRFGRELSDSSLDTAAMHAQAEFIQEKEGGLDFKLASKAVNLSGGQKQRLLLSRAFAGLPEILILDNASSALDYQTEAQLRKAIKEEYQNVTSIIIAQRISSIKDAEQILFLENGEILAIGKHKELLENCPEYKEIAEIQMGSAA